MAKHSREIYTQAYNYLKVQRKTFCFLSCHTADDGVPKALYSSSWLGRSLDHRYLVVGRKCSKNISRQPFQGYHAKKLVPFENGDALPLNCTTLRVSRLILHPISTSLQKCTVAHATPQFVNLLDSSNAVASNAETTWPFV